MKKIPLTLGFLVLIGLFVTADLYLNKLNPEVALSDFKKVTTGEVEAEVKEEGFIDSAFKLEQVFSKYTVKSQTQSSQLFDNIDLSSLGNVKIYRHKLKKGASNVVLYEILGPKGQGAITYLQLKLQFVAQIDGTNETINEVENYGDNSLFYNDENHSNTAFLLMQTGDHLYGFQFNKKNPETGEDSIVYQEVQEMIKLLSPSEETSNS